MSPRLAALALMLVAWASACEQKTVVESFSGAAWPDRRPRLPRPEGGALALVTDNGSDTISVVDLGTMGLMVKVPIGPQPIDPDGPHHLAIDPAAGAVFTAFAYPPPVVAYGPHGNHGASQSPGTLVRLALDDLRVLAQAGTDVNPGDVVLTADRSRVLVTHFDLARAQKPPGPLGGDQDRLSSLVVYDASTLARLGSVPIGLAAHGLVGSLDGRTAFVACYASDELAVVSLDEPALRVTRVPVGPGAGSGASLQYGPYAPLLSADGGSVYVSNLESRDVRVFDVARGAFDPARVGAVRGAAFFAALGPDGTTLLVPVQSPDALVVLDGETLGVRAGRSFTRAECQRPHQVARAPDGRYFLVCEGDRQAPGALIHFDPGTLEIRARVEVGVYPDAVAFVPAAM